MGDGSVCSTPLSSLRLGLAWPHHSFPTSSLSRVQESWCSGDGHKDPLPPDTPDTKCSQYCIPLLPRIWLLLVAR